MGRFLLVSILISVLSGGCTMPPPEQKNPTIEESSPEKPKKQVQVEEDLKEEFKKPPAPVPER